MMDRTIPAGEPRKRKPRLRPALRRAAKLALVVPALAGALYSPALEAATRNVVFYGSITPGGSCAITVNQTGVMGVRPDLMQLNSKLAGGRPGIATVNARGRFNLSAITPSVYTIAPNGGDTNVTRQVLYSGVKTTGAGGDFAEKDGSIPQQINGNTQTRITMHFSGTRTGTPYPNGRYQAVVVLRCE